MLEATIQGYINLQYHYSPEFSPAELRMRKYLALCLVVLAILPQLPSVSGGNDMDPYMQMMMFEKYFNGVPTLSLPSMWACAIISFGVFAVGQRMQ